jgi:hypothetical protein
MRAYMHRLSRRGLDLQLDLVQVHGTVAMFISHLDTSTQVNSIYLPAQTLDNALDHLDPRHDESGAIPAVRHRHNLDVFVVLSELSIFFADSFETLRAGNAGVVFDALAIENGHSLHDDDPPVPAIFILREDVSLCNNHHKRNTDNFNLIN